jgi:hypothetical protein
MSYELGEHGTLQLKLSDSLVRIHFRRPAPDKVIDTLVKKMPRGDETKDAGRILLANLDLGRDCVTGIEEGDLLDHGQPLVTSPERPGYADRWREVLIERAPLLLIALGQYLSSAPAFLAEPALKKTSPAPAPSSAEN